MSLVSIALASGFFITSTTWEAPYTHTHTHNVILLSHKKKNKILSFAAMWMDLEGITLTKVRIVKAMVFPVVRYGYESWTIMKADHQRIDGFKLWCWIRLLRVPGTARRSNQSILKEINPVIGRTNADAEGPILWPPDAKS